MKLGVWWNEWKGEQTFENSPNVNLSSKWHAKSALCLKQNAKDFQRNQAQTQQRKTIEWKLLCLISWNWNWSAKWLNAKSTKNTLWPRVDRFFWRQNSFGNLCFELFLLMTPSLCVERFFKCPLSRCRVNLDCRSDWITDIVSYQLAGVSWHMDTAATSAD